MNNDTVAGGCYAALMEFFDRAKGAAE